MKDFLDFFFLKQKTKINFHQRKPFFFPMKRFSRKTEKKLRHRKHKFRKQETRNQKEKTHSEMFPFHFPFLPTLLYPEMIPTGSRFFPVFSRNFQAIIKEFSWNSQGTWKELSRKFQGIFSNKTTTWQAMDFPSPTESTFSWVLAFTFTRPGEVCSRRTMFARIRGLISMT